MGNCINPVTQTATLIDGHGRLRQIILPLTAGEIMLDETGHIVSPEILIRQTRRVTALAADDELISGNLYLLIPATRANSFVSTSEMEVIDYACEKSIGTKKRHCKAVNKDFQKLPDFSVEDGTGFSGARGNLCTWRPALEPIFEESGSFRVTCRASSV